MCARLMRGPMTKAVNLFTGNLGNLSPLARIMQANVVHHLVATWADLLFRATPGTLPSSVPGN